LSTTKLKWVGLIAAWSGGFIGLAGIARHSPVAVYLAMALFVVAIAVTAVLRLRERRDARKQPDVH
jgi:hypothetical protein